MPQHRHPPLDAAGFQHLADARADDAGDEDQFGDREGQNESCGHLGTPPVDAIMPF